MPPFYLTSGFFASWRRASRYATVLVVLAGGILLVLLLRSWQVERALRNIEDYREAAIQAAFDHIQRDFSARLRGLQSQARTIAREPDVVEALLRRSRGDVEAAEGAAAYLEELRPSEWVEVYDPTLRLLAWHGWSMPLDQTSFRADHLKETRVGIVRDSDWRTVLAVWSPVEDGRRLLGAVRVMEPVEIRRRLTNRFLREHSLARVWTTSTGLEVAATFDGAAPPAEDLRSSRALHATDGTVLGWVTVESPTDEAILEEVAGRHASVASFLATLLLMWILAGIWALYHRAPPDPRKWLAAGGLALGLVLTRFALVAMDVPARWQPGKAPLAPLFDPAQFASTAGFGLLRSIGDFVLTGVFFVMVAAICVHVLVQFVRRPQRSGIAITDGRRQWMAQSAGVLIVSSLVVVLLAGLASIVRRAILDSTLDYFARSGIIPGPSEWLVAVVFCGLLLYTLAIVLLIACLMAGAFAVARGSEAGNANPLHRMALVLAALMPLALAYLVLGLDHFVPWPAAGAFLVAAGAGAYVLLLRPGEGVRLMTLRGVLMAVFVVAVLLYPMYYGAIDMKRRVQMIDASQSFDEGRDPRVIYGIEQVLTQVRRNEDIARMLEQHRDQTRRPALDSLATQVLRTSLIGSLGPYEVSVTFLSSDGRVAGRDVGAEAALGRHAADQIDSMEFDILRDMHAETGSDGHLIEQMTGRLERDRIQYAGIAPIPRSDGSGTAGWVMARVEPQTMLPYGETSFPRVLLPEGVVQSVHASISIAEFQNGMLVRSLGRPFGRYRMSEEMVERLSAEPELWVRESVEERNYVTYYRRQEAPALLSSDGPPARPLYTIMAVRGTALNTFDHLFYLLRLTVAGLLLGLPLHLVSVYVRWRAGLLPSARVSFRDKVLNAFLGVGIISVAAVGIVGRQVVRDSTEASVRSSLRQHLERVEQTLALEGRGDELTYRTLERVGVDSLAARAGLDLNVYRGWLLQESSRPQLIQDRLVDPRLPISVYRALYYEGHRFVSTTEHIGTFAYHMGFRALLDEQGLPRVVVSVPILPEQERIEEEQARTVAYLFGALLILILLVMATASILADALTRPIARLRVGLEAVARGRFERNIPVRSRDEIGELVETFNTMQEQLSESRRQLAQQERQLAWREMARQVAHEIRNPLTPMKLSVQHLRRAYEDVDGDEELTPSDHKKFDRMFDRITGTLIEQINALARIADEFSTFAKLPTSVQEELDLNAVIEQAAQLMQAEHAAELELSLQDEPLVVQADREELRRVYINLLKNAFQAIPEDREGLVIVETERQEDETGAAWALSRVIDNGLGIPDELRERIFDPNFSTKTSGMGLGLAIVRKSVTDMRGEIGFESVEEEGSTFWVRLPLAEH